MSIIAVAFAFAFDDGSRSFQFSFWMMNFLGVLLIVAFSLLARELVRKLMASRYDCATEYRLWSIERFGFGRHSRVPAKILGFKIASIPLGFFLPIIFAFITLGKFPFVATGIFIISTHLAHRTGRKYLHMTEHEDGKIALSAVMTSLALAFIFKFLSPLNPAFANASTINALLAVFHMLPFPDLDGSKIFFSGKTFYIFNFVFVLASSFMLYTLSIPTTIILALIFAIIIAINYHYFLRYK